MLLSITKRALPILAAAMFFVSCSSSKNATTVSRDSLKGSWILNRVSYDGIASNQRITLLDEGTQECLTGSTWVLPNNGYGSYTIAGAQSGCIPGQKNIVWSYRKEGDQAIFQFKKLQGGVKAKDIEEGYRFKVLTGSDTEMSLQSEITHQGQPVFITYYFSKV